MPMYEYECQACHRRTEKIQKFSDDPLTICPHCGEPRLERTITAPSFQFAGGGWYKDGYGSTKPAASSDSSSSSGDTSISASADSGSSTPATPAPASTPAAAPAPAAPSKS